MCGESADDCGDRQSGELQVSGGTCTTALAGGEGGEGESKSQTVGLQLMLQPLLLLRGEVKVQKDFTAQEIVSLKHAMLVERRR